MKRMLHPAAIVVEDRGLPSDAFEVARLWTGAGGATTCFVEADRIAEPELFGFLIADAAIVGARAFAQRDGIPEKAAIRRIWEGAQSRRRYNLVLHDLRQR